MTVPVQLVAGVNSLLLPHTMSNQWKLAIRQFGKWFIELTKGTYLQGSVTKGKLLPLEQKTFLFSYLVTVVQHRHLSHSGEIR